LTTLAALISGIVGSQSTQLPKIAAHVSDGAQPESRAKRFARWLKNDYGTEEVYFVPFAEVLVIPLAWQTLVLVIDGSVVGRGCVALMLHVVYKGRALPIAWLVRRGKKGHFPEEMHLALLEQVTEIDGEAMLQRLAASLQTIHDPSQRRDMAFRLMEQQSHERLPDVEKFPVHFYTDGITSLENALRMRQIVALEHWRGHTACTLGEVIHKVSAGL